MTENTSTPRLPKAIRLVYAFIKWTAVAISLLLLILGLFLAMPWRILLVFAVIPAVGIFMPHDLQKWCWMAMAIVTIAIYVWIRSPEQNASQWRPYVFEEKTAEYLRKRQIPDSINAALRYEELFKRHEEGIFARPVDDQAELAAYLQPWEEIAQPELTQWIKTLETDMAFLIETAAISECRFTPSVDIKTLNEQFKRLNTLKALLRILVQSANQDIQKGLYQSALQKKLTVLQTAQHLWMQKTLLDQAAGYFLERMGRRALSRFVIMNVSDLNTLSAIEQEYQQLNSGWPKCWGEILANEKILTAGMSGLFYQQNQQGHVRFSRNIAEGLRRHMGSRISKYALSPEISRMIVLVLGLSIPAEPEGVTYLIEKRFDRYSAIVLSGIDLETTEPQEWWHDGLNASSIIDWYVRQRVAYYHALASQNNQFEQNRAAMTILITLKRYQVEKTVWPESLQAAFNEIPIPVDPISQKPFVYKKQDAGFTLYSLGKNGLDDNGIKNSIAKQDDTLFWPAASITNEQDPHSRQSANN
jgi:hypothetical protein